MLRPFRATPEVGVKRAKRLKPRNPVAMRTRL